MDKKVALVTGASRGIGAAILEHLGEQGFVAVGTATSRAGADKIAEAVAARGHAGGGLQLNVNDSESCDACIKQITDAHGPIQVLVNNAGITRDQLLLRMSDSDWDDIFATNLKSIYTLSKRCLRPMMKARWGRIVSIASVVGLTGNPGQANYAAAKAGMIGFSKSLAQEVGSRGITVNVVAPGFIQTDMTDELNDDQRAKLLGQIPLDRLGQPADIAAAVGFLCSDAAGYITGETMHVNGGMYMA